MNTVPFDQLGPGQSGRLAYQVLGQDGPIFNPQNIRYLPPDSLEIPTNAMSEGPDIWAGLNGASLISSILNLGISAYIAPRISNLRRTVDHLQGTLDYVNAKIDYIVAKIDRIDIQVAENNLRHSLNHVLHKAVSPDKIDLRVLTDLCDDINKFTKSLSSSLMLNFGLQLSSDIRDQLRLTCDLIYGIRVLVAQRYNNLIQGQPMNVITVNSNRDYFSIFGDGDLAVHVRATMNLPKEYSQRMGWLDFDDYLPQHHRYIFTDENSEVVAQGLYGLGYAWLHQTDAGLLWRTWIELRGIADGYENVFWSQLKETEPCGFNQIDVACDVD